MAAEAAIEIEGLRKSYGSFEAVRGLSLRVQRGEIFAFLGPNGAGKTTTVEILEGFRHRDAGDVRVLGIDPEHGDRGWRSRIGIVLQEGEAQPELTVRETLALWAAYYPSPRPVEETIGLAGLQEKADDRAGRLSGGQRRRLDVGLALIGDPDLVFLDEPTTGFDPVARRAAWKVIAGLRDLGKTVFLTAILPVIFLCLFVGIFGNGRVEAYDNVRASTLYVPSFIALAVISASFVALAIGFTRMRESGVLKRVRATPVPPWIVFAGRIGTSIVTAALITALLMAIGALVFGVSLPTHTLPGLLAALAAGAAAFCALGIAYTRVIPSVDAGPAMTNAVVLPLYFISGVFSPFRDLPEGLQSVAKLLPVQPFVDALQIAFDPHTSGAGVAGGDLLALAIWGFAGLILAVRLFGWTPRQQSG